jgi:hypothetical protein
MPTRRDPDIASGTQGGEIPDRIDSIAPVPRVTLTRAEAAASLGVSLDSFETHVQPDVRMIRLGAIRLVPVSELQRWATENAERAPR